MKQNLVEEERIQYLNHLPIHHRGDYLLYWMQASQRAEWNHALEYAILQANILRKPLLVFFGLATDFPEANQRHYQFMLEGLKETRAKLIKRGIKMAVKIGSPDTGVVEAAKRAVLAIVDRGYLRIQRTWREQAAKNLPCPLWQVESKVVIPVEVASDHEEYGAYTLRPKIRKLLKRFMRPVEEIQPEFSSLSLQPFEWETELSNIEDLIRTLPIDKTVPPVNLRGGTEEAKRKLRVFVTQKLPYYAKWRNDPTKNVLSEMSPYLHFGQISPLSIALQVANADCSEPASQEAYIEELIVRRELAANFVFYNSSYDSWNALPEWSRKTLTKHSKDLRKYLYSIEELEHAKTHDQLWNAAQKELLLTGKIHGYVRMYWGKKILEWSETPQEAFRIALYLNNKYALDGRDANSFAGVAWCFGKHDRAFSERPIFGKVRYMSLNGMQRKFPVHQYIQKVENLVHQLER